MSGSALAFKYFPSQLWRPSGVFAEFDASQANTATQNQRTLIVGQITSAGTATPNIAVQAYSQAQVNGLCGFNSMLALKYAAYRLLDPFGEVWIGAVSDASGGTAATGNIVFTGPATAAGTLALYLMGVSIPVAVNVGDSAMTIATNTVAAIAGAIGVCCTAVRALNAAAGLTAWAGSPDSSVAVLSWTAPAVDVTHDAPATYQPRFALPFGGSWTDFGSPISGTAVSVTGLAHAAGYNWLAPVEAPKADISGALWIIGSVTFREDMSGTHADLILMPPDAFSPNPNPLNLFDAELARSPRISQSPAPPAP